MNNEQQYDIKTAIDAGVALADPRFPADAEHDRTPFVVVPHGYNIQSLEKMFPTPLRKSGTVNLGDTASFIEYIKKHGEKDTCTIYADIDQQESKASYVAVLNDHGKSPESPQWRDHKCTFTPKQSVEWKRWTASDKRQMEQSVFATWLEDNLADIASQDKMPTGADMLQMALNFERNATKRYKQKLDLQGGGVQFEYVDDEEKDTRTQMKVFERFALGMRVFVGGDAYAMQARLKYRESSGKLVFWYELIRPDKVFEAASQDIIDAVREETGMLVLLGSIY